MGRTAIHERGCDWCKLFPEISWYKKLAFLSSSVSFYDYLKWILKMTFERHQINLFLTFPLFFAERGEMAFYSLLDLKVEMRSYQNHQPVSNINE